MLPFSREKRWWWYINTFKYCQDGIPRRMEFVKSKECPVEGPAAVSYVCLCDTVLSRRPQWLVSRVRPPTHLFAISSSKSPRRDVFSLWRWPTLVLSGSIDVAEPSGRRDGFSRHRIKLGKCMSIVTSPFVYFFFTTCGAASVTVPIAVHWHLATAR